jgi:hypothetical protein
MSASVFRLAAATAALTWSAVAFAQPASAPAAPAPAEFGQPLNCAAVSAADATLLTSKDRGFELDPADGQWVLAALKRVGYPAPLPAAGASRNAALSASGLLRRGEIVAAKMANDEAMARVTGYKAAPFASSFETLLTISTQPVSHATYPEAVRAEGEEREPGPHANTHGVDMERASASLSEIIGRASVSKKAMGADYQNSAVRNYLLAHGFHDASALRAARAAVCAAGLPEAMRAKLDISARFMAMPSKQAPR